jgi:glycolate oxidase iron-sulfur subunit
VHALRDVPAHLPHLRRDGTSGNSPRGRIALMRAVADGELEISPTFADEMSYCLGCLACQTACPAGVQYGVLFETARSDIREAGVRRTA